MSSLRSSPVQITFHQARFGQDEQRGFGLLDTTHPDKALIRSLSFAANLAETPPDHLRWGPALRGVAQGDSYMVLRTFADTSPGMRPGRVFSHALLADAKQVALLSDLRPVLNHLPHSLDKHTVLTRVELHVSNAATATADLSPRLGKLLQALVTHGDVQPIVWADEADFTDAVCLVWRALWPDLRQQFRFGIGFSEREVKQAGPQLLTVPSSLLNPWKGYPIIRSIDTHTALSEVEHYLLDNHHISSNLASLLAEVDAQPVTLRDLESIQTVTTTFPRLAQATLPELLALSSVVASLQPSPKLAEPLKQQIVTAITSTITQSDLEGLLQVRTFGWHAAFGNAASQLKSIVARRLAELLQHNPSLELATLLARQAADNTPIWWKESVETGMQRVFASWRPELASLVYSVWSNAHVASRLSKFLSRDASIEDDLVATLPRELGKASAQAGVRLAKDKGWFTLHVACALRYLPLATALDQQLSQDASDANWAALRYAQKAASPANFVKAAVELADARLFELAGELSVAQPALFDLILVETTNWQLFWEASLAHGASDAGIKARTWTLLDHLLTGGVVESKLLHSLSDTAAANLLDYPQRAAVWPRLPAESKRGFLWATALAAAEQKAGVGDADLAPPLLTTLCSSDFANDYLQRHLSDLSTASLYWTRFTVAESVVMGYLQRFNGELSPIQAQHLGKHIFAQHWSTAATSIFHLARANAAFYPALVECLALLPLMDKLHALVLVRKTKKIAVKHMDWWEALLSELCKVYPYGPTQDKIWHHSGGNESWLNPSKSGDEQWRTLLQRLQRDSLNSLEPFVATLVRENRHNSTFQLLYDLLLNNA